MNTISQKVKSIFGTSDSEQKTQDGAEEYRKKTREIFGTGISPQSLTRKINPYLNREGELVNKYLNYQQLLDSGKTSQKAKEFITQATGLLPAEKVKAAAQEPAAYKDYAKPGGTNRSFKFDSGADENNLVSLDVMTELPKLDTEQISQIISTYFNKSPVIKPSDAEGIYNAQQKSGMSALAILGIGALESGYGTSNIAKQKNNIWGWNATNENPGGNASSFSPISRGALEFANKYLDTYYNGYGAKSIYSAGTGDNPSGKGYAYYDNGSINSQWAADVGSIMKNFYKTAKGASPAVPQSAGSSIVDSAFKYMGKPYVWGGESMSEGGYDCSGFIYAALKDAGYDIGRTTAEGYRQKGETVSKNNLQPGDLVFYGDKKATHVAIYIGNGQVIQSSGGSKNTKSNPGKGVCVKNIDYRNDYIGAKRY